MKLLRSAYVLAPLTTVYFDMDDVLVDFFGKIEKVYPDLLDKKQSAYEKSQWDAVGSKLNQFAQMGCFRSCLPTIEFKALESLAHLLLQKGVNVAILSSRSEKLCSGSNVVRDKTGWLYEHSPDIFAKMPLIFTPDGKSKAMFGNPNALLIDDSERNCLEFSRVGGNAVVWSDKTSVIALMYMLEMKLSNPTHLYTLRDYE